MVGSKRSSKGSKFSMKTTPAAVSSGDPPLGFKYPPTLIGEKTIDPSVIALRAKNYAKAYADPLMRQKWNMYVSFGIQQFISPQEYIAHRAQETTDGRNLRLARYYRYHLENLANVDSYLIRTMGAVETALMTSHPGFFDMSTTDMDAYMAALPENKLEIEFPTPPDNDNDASTNNDSHSGSSLSVAAEKSRHDDTPAQKSHSNENANKQTEKFIAVPVTPKRSNTSDTESPDEDVTPMEITTETHPKSPNVQTPPRMEEQKRNDAPVDILANETMDEYFGATPTHPIPLLCDNSTVPIVDKPHLTDRRDSAKTAKHRKGGRTAKGKKPPDMKPTAEATLNHHPPKSVEKTVRIEVRWAPADFHELRASTDKMFSRLAPILSCFNTRYTWMVEWQTNQMEDSVDLDPKQLAKYLSIRISPVVKEGAFYFSFRISATGSQFTQVVKSEIMKTAKMGERMSFDPTMIPPQQGELIFVGDILLKDANNTHRGNYLRYLRKEVLPEDTPAFDIKIRHKDPIGNPVKILTVRCGKVSSTKVAEILSTALCGEGKNTEIFISRLAIGANKTSKQEHARIYQVHIDYLQDIVYIPFTIPAIDTPATEYLESGETTMQTPRQWAKSLVALDGTSMEIDLENGTADGSALLMTPSASETQLKLELSKYLTRQNPSLSNATALYTASLNAHPTIPKTVFTKNIDTILAKRFKTVSHVPGNDEASTPASSITGATSRASTVAWKIPLQETLKQSATTRKKPMSSNEINQLKRIAILEAQLALSYNPDVSVATSSKASTVSSKASKSTRSKQSTKASRASSQLSDHSPLTAATAHSRLDSLEEAMHDIRRLLKKIVTHQVTPNPADTRSQDETPEPDSRTDQHLVIAESPPPTSGKSMDGVQVFPDGLNDGTSTSTLAMPQTPKKPKNKRRKPTDSPSPSSNLRPQYKETSGARGGETC